MAANSAGNHQPIIRLACLEDVERISLLCEQLGYSATFEDIKHRLCLLQQDETHVVYVASLTNKFVVGWVHAHESHLVIMPPQVLVLGLVVDEHYRRYGIGRLLMQQVEQWALAHSCQAVRLRSNVIRKDAHHFYEKMGYKNTKYSLEFCKNLI